MEYEVSTVGTEFIIAFGLLDCLYTKGYTKLN